MSSQTVFINKAATNQSLDIGPILNSTSGVALTGLAYNTASLACRYRRGALGTVSTLTLATLALVSTAHAGSAGGGFIELDATNADGMYRLDFSDAILATGEDRAMVILQGAANMQPHTIHIVLTDEIATGADNGVLLSSSDTLVNAACDTAIADAALATAANLATVNTAVVTDIPATIATVNTAVVTTIPATIATVDTVVDLILVDTGTTIPATLAALPAANVVAILAAIIEDAPSTTLQQALSLILANSAGITATNGTLIKSPDGVENRIAATIDGSNNRTAMTLTPAVL